MGKLRKDLSGVEKNKSKVVIVTGKITKPKKFNETPQTRKVQENIHSPARLQQRNLENSISATPFPANSTLKFTSTPMNAENTIPNGSERLPLKKLPLRLALSPIFNNICNTKQQRKEKGSNVKVPKENLQKSDMSGPKFNKENLDSDIRIGTRRKSFGVRRIAPVSENARTLVNKHNTESPSSRLRVRLRKLDTSSESLVSDLQSTKQSKTNASQKHNTESSSSRLRVRLRKLDTSVESLVSDLQSTKQSKTNTSQKHTNNYKNKPDRSDVFSDSSVSPDSKNVHRRATDKLPPDSGKNYTMTTPLRSDCSSTTLGEEISTSSVAQKLDMTSKSTEMSDAKQKYKNNCSKLRVRLRRSTLNPNPPFMDVNPKQRKSYIDNSLVNRLKSDWTNTTFEDTPSQKRTPKDNRVEKKQVHKRRLTPLVEMSLEDTSHTTDTLTATPKKANRIQSDSCEKEYSSSAEFQSEDEGNHRSRSKRAPTWKDLLNKTNESPVLKRSRRLDYETGTNVALSPEKEIEKSQQNEKSNEFSDSCKVVESVIKVKKAPNVDKESKGPTEKKKIDVEVSNDVSFKESHEIRRKNQDSAQYVTVCEETIATATSTPQHNNLQKTDAIKNTSLSFRRDATARNETIDLRCPVKFFHSRLENTVSEAKPTENLKRRRSSRRKNQESIYEFLSQSSSESNNQLDDVIQKMIKTGKAVVAKHKKGTGKNILPRKKPGRNLRKKTTKEIPLKSTKPLATQPTIRQKIQNDFDDNLHFGDSFHFDDGENDIPEEEQLRDQRGFSNLARSAMIKQAGRTQKPLQRKPITDKKKLLEMAMKFVNQSTPVRMTTPQPINGPQLSPMAGNKSPWRVDDDKLPNLFYLGRNSDNLPSFSSDYIPMTPTKNNSKSISSFSSNDSNGENKAPSGTEIFSNDSNMQVLTNTRKALTYRSPLKAINIIEVVNLPPLALHSYGKKSNDENASKNNLKETTRSLTRKSAQNVSTNNSINNSNSNSNNESNNNSMNNSNNNLNNKSNNNSINNSTNNSNNNSDNYLNKSNHSKSDVSNEYAENQCENTYNQTQSSIKSKIDITNNNNLTNLFGFEELIDNENNSSNITVDKTILPNKDVLKERLQRLKQLRPNKPVVIPNKTNRIRPVFDNEKPRQKTLKQMLCSTMIDDKQHHKSDATNHSFNEIEDLSNLFKDPDPETTFDDSHPRRTYNRPFKRKRKILHDFATIMGSDVSEDEEEAVEKSIKKYKAKPKKRQKNDPELKKFVNDFNEMCKEVSQYELIVE